MGVGRTVITPQGPIWMSGYASRNHPSEGVIHDLWAKALAIEDSSGGRVVLVTTDLVGLPHELAEEVAARLKAKHGLDRSQIVLNSSHTHSGPVVWPNLKSMYFLGRKTAIGSSNTARSSPTILSAQSMRQWPIAPRPSSPSATDPWASPSTAASRRQTGVRLGVNQKGPVDHDVPVLKVAAPDGKLRAVLFAYACHNTTLAATCTRSTAITRALPRSSWRKPCRARRRCSRSSAAAIRTRSPAARSSWPDSTARRLPTKSAACLAANFAPCAGRSARPMK